MGEKLYSTFKWFCFNVAKSNTMQDAVPYIPERNFKYMFFSLFLVLITAVVYFVLGGLISLCNKGILLYRKTGNFDSLVKFKTGSFQDEIDGHSRETYETIEYSGRVYIRFGMYHNCSVWKYLGNCVGYIETENKKSFKTNKRYKGKKVFTLHDGFKDKTNLNCDFLLEYDDSNGYCLEESAVVLRAIDTRGKDSEMNIPYKFIRNSNYEFWND